MKFVSQIVLVFLLLRLTGLGQVDSVGKKSLLVVGCDLSCQNQTIYRLDLENGRVVSKETVAIIPITHSDLLSNSPLLLENRYVVASDSGIFDLSDKKLYNEHRGRFVGIKDGRAIIHQYNIGSGRAPLPLSTIEQEKMVSSATGKPVPPNTVILTTGKENHKVFEFDLMLKAYAEMKTPNFYSLGPQYTSPDLMKGVDHDMFSGSLILVKRGKKASDVEHRRLVGKYRVSCSDCISRVPPILWVDDDRFITQEDNGELVLYDVRKDKRKTFERLPLPKVLKEGPWFTKSDDGTVYYNADKVYRVNLEALTLEEAREIPMGHNFTRSSSTPSTSLMFDGKVIGSFLTYRTIVGEGGYLVAEEHGKVNSRYPKAIKIWTKETGSWADLEIGSRPRIIGWISD